MAGTSEPDRTFKTHPPLLFWNAGWIRPEAQREIAERLKNPVESRIFESLPTPALPQSVLDCVCWIRRSDRLHPFFLFLAQWTPYEVGVAYEKAKTEFDGQFSPHTAFRSLSAGNNWAAVDFVNEFGPLELLDESEPRRSLTQVDLLDFGEFFPGEKEPPPKERGVWVDVEDFWEKHKRFTSVAKLWETRENHSNLVMALGELAYLSVYPPIGALRVGQSYSPANPFPWEDGKFLEWRRKANENVATQAVSEIIKKELDLQAHQMEIRWRCPDPRRLAFQLAPHPKSLWMAIWHLFARDTVEGIGWRICPHCSKVFYPKRKDSYFCESKYQKLHAANRWWSEHSEAELDKRRKERAQKGLTRRKTARNRRARGRK